MPLAHVLYTELATIYIAIENLPTNLPIEAGVLDVAMHAHRFTGLREHRVVPGVGHNLQQEVPQAFADAVMALVQ